MAPPSYPLQREGPLCLDLANTLISDRSGRDLLATDDQLAAWVASLETGLDPGSLDASAAERLRALRSVVRALLIAAIERRPLDPALVAELNAVAAGAPVTPRLVVTEGEPGVRSVQAGGTPLAGLLGALARPAIELLGGDRRSLLRACPGERCRLLFVASDPRRVWCDSATCGNRARVARHRAASRG